MLEERCQQQGKDIRTYIAFAMTAAKFGRDVVSNFDFMTVLVLLSHRGRYTITRDAVLLYFPSF
jgi:hypothetical protein